jgi:predicted PurR-regulated permease PerM
MFRMSLRGMLLLVALFAMAVVSLVYANDFWVSVITGILMVAFIAALIVAFVDRGFPQAFAIGFVLAVFAYAFALLSGFSSLSSGNVASNVRNVEFTHEGRLPTTRSLRFLHQAVTRHTYTDSWGKPLPNFDPAKASKTAAMGGGGGGFFPGLGSNRYIIHESPSRETFMPIGHSWWALLIGSLGGAFAVYVYRRRLRNEEKLPGDVS